MPLARWWTNDWNDLLWFSRSAVFSKRIVRYRDDVVPFSQIRPRTTERTQPATDDRETSASQIYWRLTTDNWLLITKKPQRQERKLSIPNLLATDYWQLATDGKETIAARENPQHSKFTGDWLLTTGHWWQRNHSVNTGFICSPVASFQLSVVSVFDQLIFQL